MASSPVPATPALNSVARNSVVKNRLGGPFGKRLVIFDHRQRVISKPLEGVPQCVVASDGIQ